MMAASRYAIKNSVAVAESLKVSPFIIGITLVAVGTDTPEIFNSIMSSYLGKGDINVGDSIGSVFTQSSLVLGLFPFVAGVPIMILRKDILLIAGLIILSLVSGLLLAGDGQISRWDALCLMLLWLTTSTLAIYFQSAQPEPISELRENHRHIFTHVILALLSFAVVGFAATGLIRSITEISLMFQVPEYILSFFGAALGTSLPEFAVEFTAIRRNQRQMALGDVLGSCLVDASLSIGIGPALFPTLVSSELVTKGYWAALFSILVAALLLAIRKKHDRISGLVLIAVYLSAYFIK